MNRFQLILGILLATMLCATAPAELTTTQRESILQEAQADYDTGTAELKSDPAGAIAASTARAASACRPSIHSSDCARPTTTAAAFTNSQPSVANLPLDTFVTAPTTAAVTTREPGHSQVAAGRGRASLRIGA